MFKNEEII